MATETPRQDDGTEAPQEERRRGLRVAWLAGERTFARFGRVLEPLAIGLMDEPIRLVVACPEEAEIRGLPEPAVEIIRYRRPRWWNPYRRRWLEDLAGRLREMKITLVHSLEADRATEARRLARMIDARYIVSCWSLSDRHRLWSAGSRCAAILAGSESIRAQLLKHGLVSGQKIRLLRPGVYQTRRASCFTGPALSATILASGPMDHSRPFETVFRCFAELQARKCDCSFFVLGNGRAERSIRKQAEKMHLRDKLTFADRQPSAQMPGIFRAADLYVAPSPMQEIDIDSLLAMSAGVPVLSAGQGASDFIRDSQTAMLYSPDDAAELTAKLAALLDDHDSATSLAENALSYLREHHSAGKMLAAMLEVYREAAG